VATRFRIGLLGRFRVAVGGVEVPGEAWRCSKAAALVKLLALAPAHRMHREQVMDVLWPTLGPAAAANLRKAVHYARRALDVEGSSAIVSSGEMLSLPSGQVVIDLEVWRAAAGRASVRFRKYVRHLIRGANRRAAVKVSSGVRSGQGLCMAWKEVTASPPVDR